MPVAPEGTRQHKPEARARVFAVTSGPRPFALRPRHPYVEPGRNATDGVPYGRREPYPSPSEGEGETESQRAAAGFDDADVLHELAVGAALAAADVEDP